MISETRKWGANLVAGLGWGGLIEGGHNDWVDLVLESSLFFPGITASRGQC